MSTKKAIYLFVVIFSVCVLAFSAFGVFMGFDMGRGPTVVFWGAVGILAFVVAVGCGIAAIRQKDPSVKVVEDAIAEKEKKYLQDRTGKTND